MKTIKAILIASVMILLFACEKPQAEAPEVGPVPLYKVSYWVNADSAVALFKINKEYHFKYVYGQWDTSYYCNYGKVELYCESLKPTMSCGYSVNGCVIDSDSNIQYFESTFKLP